MRRLSRYGAAALAGATVLLLAGPAAAENPVLDPVDDVDVAAALAEATQVQDVCYGYVLTVSDADTGQFSGTYAASSAGPDVTATRSADCPGGVVELLAQISYTSAFSEAEDGAAWQVVSDLPEITTADVEGLGLSSRDLLDDSRSATTLLNAVLALPRLASEQAGLPPVVLEPNTAELPPDAQPTGTPGSDWLRENGARLALCVFAIVGGVLALLAARAQDRTRAPRFSRFGPPRTPPHPQDWSPR